MLNTQSKGIIVNLKDKDWLHRQKIAGLACSQIHKNFFWMFKKKAKLNLKHLEEFAALYMSKMDCTPTFYKYKSFPGKICTSVNNVIVHGFPIDYDIEEGDIVKIDVGATYEGAIGDCAFTYVYGKVKDPKIGDMLLACQDSLKLSIKAMQVGKRLGVIGSTIFDHSKKTGFGVLTNFGGHGIDYDKVHAEPFVANKARADEGVVIQPGLSIAIEPMFVLGSNVNTKIGKDGWSVYTKDIGCHYEHSVTVDDEGVVHIITEHGNEVKSMLE